MKLLPAIFTDLLAPIKVGRNYYLSTLLFYRIKLPQLAVRQQRNIPSKPLLLLLLFSAVLPAMLPPNAFAQAAAQTETSNNTADTTSEPNTGNQQTTEQQTPKVTTKTVPDTQAQRVAQLKAQYPPADIRQLADSEGSFNALWREDQSGDAFGAILIIPTDGQTANWPHSINVLRTELPLHGWSTLTIDIAPIAEKKIPKRPKKKIKASSTPEDSNTEQASETEQADAITQQNDIQDSDTNKNEDGNEPLADDAKALAENENSSEPKMVDKNTHGHDRIKAGLNYLHEQGQYNVVVLGYGNSARRALQFAKTTNPEDSKSRPKRNADYPLRAIILINPSNFDEGQLSQIYDDLAYKSTPILDVLYQTHYLDYTEAKARKMKARRLGFMNYTQVRLLEPSTTIFNDENRLSRRVRGFLDRHAKGVEVGGR